MQKLSLYSKKKVVVGWKQNMLAALFALVIWAPLAIMAFDHNPAVIRHSGFIKPVVAIPGNEVQVTWNVEIKRHCIGEVRRVITDSDGIEWRLAPVPSEADRDIGKKTIIRKFIVPLAATPGPATYKAIVTSKCNPLQHLWPVVNEQPVLNFEIGLTPLLAIPEVKKGL